MQTVLSLQIVGNPEEIEPPDGVNHEFSSGKGPSLSVRQELPPFYFTGLLDGIAVYVLSFAAGAVGMFFRLSIQPQPDNEPGESQRAGHQKCPAPSKVYGDPRDNEWRNDCADVRSGVEDSRCEGPLFFWKPLRHALNACRKYSGLPETQCGTSRYKTGKRERERVPHGCQAPENHGHGVTNSRTQAIDQAADKNHAQRIGGLEGKHKISIIDFIPAKLMLERNFEHAEHLPVHIVFGHAEK